MPWQAAVAPHIAAQQEGKPLQASRLAGLCRGVMLGGADFVLIEGAGGWRVPINPRETLADLAVQLQVGVILVVGMRLGCINHALLTAEAIAGMGCNWPAGWPTSPGSAWPATKKTWTPCGDCCRRRCWGRCPSCRPLTPEAAAKSLSLEHLLG